MNQDAGTMTHMRGEQGIALVLAIFMLALLSMIGVASMMLSTTEVEITGNEKSSQTVFYQAESGLTIGGEIIELLDGYDEVADDYTFDDAGRVRVVDGDFLFEPKDLSLGEWDKDNQTDGIYLRRGDATAHASLRRLDSASVPDIVYDNQTFVDVDKVAVRFLEGGGAEFGSGAQGIGVSTHKVIYNVNSIGTLSAGQAAADHVLGYQFIP